MQPCLFKSLERVLQGWCKSLQTAVKIYQIARRTTLLAEWIVYPAKLFGDVGMELLVTSY